jgi:hypothetical protein
MDPGTQGLLEIHETFLEVVRVQSSETVDVFKVFSNHCKGKSKSNYHILSVAAGNFIIALFGI